MWLISCIFCLMYHIIIQAHTEQAYLNRRHDLTLQNRADPEVFHDCIFATKLKNLEILKNILNDVSNPDSPSYGQYMSHDAIGTMWQNEEAVSHVLEFANTHDIAIVEQSPFGEFITARASIRVWERLLSAEFHVFDRLDSAGENLPPILRANHYTIPATLTTHVDAIFNTVQMPVVTHSRKSSILFTHRPNFTDRTRLRGSSVRIADGQGWVDPDFLKALYGITGVGNANASQYVFATMDNYFSPMDLRFFEVQYNLPLTAVAVVGGHNSSSICISTPEVCYDSDLALEYIMSTAQDVPTTYDYDNSTDPVISLLTKLANMTKPPQVVLITYGWSEGSISRSHAASFDALAMSLGLKGVTIVVRSGDDGAPGYRANQGPSFCSYDPMWPATSPYVLVVGATQGPENGSPEIVCSSNTNGLITSGGGFSNYYSQPMWQTEAVNGYFSVVSTTSMNPTTGFNSSGRAYPDISLIGSSYLTWVGNSVTLQYSTSASAAVVAGMISLINAARIKNGRRAVGWINKYVYQNHSVFSNDITSGNNFCTTGPDTVTAGVCCSEGFYSVAGWDPVSGFGSIDYRNFYNVFYNLGYASTPVPSLTPTASPSRQPTTPTVSPTHFPTRTPITIHPTTAPSPRPTRSPTADSSNPNSTTSPKQDYTVRNIIVGICVAFGVVFFGIVIFYYLRWQRRQDTLNHQFASDRTVSAGTNVNNRPSGIPRTKSVNLVSIGSRRNLNHYDLDRDEASVTEAYIPRRSSSQRNLRKSSPRARGHREAPVALSQYLPVQEPLFEDPTLFELDFADDEFNARFDDSNVEAANTEEPSHSQVPAADLNVNSSAFEETAFGKSTNLTEEDVNMFSAEANEGDGNEELHLEHGRDNNINNTEDNDVDDDNDEENSEEKSSEDYN